MSHSLKPFSLDLSRRESLFMRGFAIFCIIVHNFCHWMPDTVRENEATWFIDRPLDFIDRLVTLSPTLGFDIFSFLGWYPIAVFMFLTGYGLVRKYESASAPEPFRPARFMFHNWLKLFRLALSGVALFVVVQFAINLATGLSPLHNLRGPLFSITFLNDLIYNLLPPNPGVYWYFGLTLEFYLIYALLIKGKNRSMLSMLVLLSVILQIVALPSDFNGQSQEFLLWIRKNATGWMAVMAMGVWCARRASVPRAIAWCCIIASLILFIPCMLNGVTWLFTPLFVVVLFLALARYSSRLSWWGAFWVWAGNLSAFLFVAHPAARILVYASFDVETSPALALAVYLPLSVLLAYAARAISSRLRLGINALLKRG